LITPSLIIRNIGSIWFAFLIQIVVTFFLTPIVIDKLGAEGYGVWILLQSLNGYYGLIDMGLRAGVTQTVTSRIASGDISSLVSYISGTLPMLARISMFIMLAGFVVGYLLTMTLQVSPSLQSTLLPLVILQTLGIGISLITFPFSSVLVGMQRYDIQAGIGVSTRLMNTVVTLCVLKYTNNLFYLSSAYLAVEVLERLTVCAISYRLVPALSQVRPKNNRSEVREFYRVSGWNFLVSISQQILQRFNTLVAAYMFSVANLVPFSLAGSLAEHSGKMTTMAARVLFPAFSHLSHKGTSAQTQALFQISSRISLAISLSAVSTGLIWFEPFMNLWLKSISDKDSIISSAKILFVAYGLINVFNSIRSIGWQVVLGKDKVEFIGKTMLLETAIAVPLSFSLAWGVGVFGLVLGNLLAIGFSTLWICMPMFSKLINKSYATNMRDVFLRPMLYGILSSAVLYGWSRIVVVPSTWAELLYLGAIPTLGILALASPILFTTAELEYVRQRLFKARFFGKLSD
jgi:O-antigen/teichoic acid export membrane protein